ncbi:MAG TPA: hypothetical protein VGN18_01050 [Jatrophihabitans sp.]|uniref:hypothetical protein n=1 Tax=Jatrophihabitans sp. TaxID=1932789 RepID=UPI002DFFA304|nr:hypothetical protein [Jatrophihabitans sp.]
MRTGPGSGPAPARPSRATPPRVPNSPDSPRTVVPRRATPEAWAAYLAETAPVEVVVPEPAARRSRVGAVVTGGAVVTALALTLVALTLAPRTSAASAPGERPVARPAGRGVAPAPAPQPFPGRVAASVRQVVSVVAASSVSRTAVLRRWQRDATGTWHAVGAPARVELGAGGLTRSPSDQRPQTPIGTWAMDTVLTRDAGVTRLPEHVLRPGDGWSSCLSCANYDRLAQSGELWAGRNTWSRIAIHIVTNPRHLRGRSSGIFLHVGAGGPTAGCIGTSLPVAVSVAGWLDPAARPRIVVAVRG